MSIQILNNGASLKIVRDGASRLVLKQQIKEVSTSGTNLKIETSGCSSSCLFFPFAEVTDPATGGVTALRDAVNEMLNNSIEGATLNIAGFSTEQKQNETLNKLTQLNTTLATTSADLQGTLQDLLSGKSTEVTQLDILTLLTQLRSDLTLARDTITAAVNSGNELLDEANGQRGALGASFPGLFSTLATTALQTDGNNKLHDIRAFANDMVNQLESIESIIPVSLTDKATASRQDTQTTKLTEIAAAILAAQNAIVAAVNLISGSGGDGGSSATADKQDEQTTVLSLINQSITNLRTTVQALDTDLANGLSDKSTAALQTVGNNRLQDILSNTMDSLSQLNALEVAISNGLFGKSTEQKQAEAIVKLGEIKTVLLDMQVALLNEIQNDLNGKSTEAKQDALITLVGQTNVSITALQNALASAIQTGPNDMATQSRQDDILTGIGSILTSVNQLVSEVQRLNEYRYDYPLRQETSGMTIYKGYAIAGAGISDGVWAIQRTTLTSEGNYTVEWSNGTRNFNTKWDDRATLIYQ